MFATLLDAGEEGAAPPGAADPNASEGGQGDAVAGLGFVLLTLGVPGAAVAPASSGSGSGEEMAQDPDAPPVARTEGGRPAPVEPPTPFSPQAAPAEGEARAALSLPGGTVVAGRAAAVAVPQAPPGGMPDSGDAVPDGPDLPGGRGIAADPATHAAAMPAGTAAGRPAAIPSAAVPPDATVILAAQPAVAMQAAAQAAPVRAMAEGGGRPAVRPGPEATAATPATSAVADTVPPLSAAPPPAAAVPGALSSMVTDGPASVGAGPEASLAPVLREAASPAPTSPGAPPAAAPPAPVAGQLAIAARSLPDGPVEIALSPAELGRVTLTLSASETSIAVTLLAERGETLELLRRSIGQLADELRALGYDNPSFSFSGEAGGRDRGQRADRAGAFAIVDAAPAAAAAAGPRTVQGLDLRL
ncbi:flagellar hook-length control protein FliK [Rhodobaculum claviforme]|uniref:Flagellar hook-length control protein-like C-terminal domain-containing protein n=1 Tax=Rhodobaculum claviforme TaxID=1549854 RepID=A0A934TNY8_9RHOB|nr:flagellar hook-length control protein FliK [Rhodobaculum claviforme]MBK5928563.1 hypothetical protein [Rhodobaculum claviforme]